MQAPSYFSGFDPTTSQSAPSSRASLSRGLGGIIGNDDRKLVNGQASQYPFSTALKLNYKKANGGSYICSGSLINKRLVLTAGHCVYDRKTLLFMTWKQRDIHTLLELFAILYCIHVL